MRPAVRLSVEGSVVSLYASAGPYRSRPVFDRGTLLRTEGPVFVIGAVNMDISGTPAAELRTGDSNPGRVTLSPGGVGRNIAENLRLLGRKVDLVATGSVKPFAQDSINRDKILVYERT